MEKEIKVKYLDYMMIGDKATNYSNPLIIETIKKYNGFLVIYTKQINGYCIAIDEESFNNAYNKYKGE